MTARRLVPPVAASTVVDLRPDGGRAWRAGGLSLMVTMMLTMMLTLTLAAASLAHAQTAAAPVASPTASAPQDRSTLERRVQSVGTLIEASSAARQIDASGVAAARERRDTARLLHREAQAQVQGGDLTAAARLLDQAAREMMQGVRLARPEDVAGEKARRDFDTRLASTRALLAAQQRITQEKTAAGAAPPQAAAATAGIADDLAAAEQLVAAGRLGEARDRLDKAYLTARVSIEAMRRGDTLVRSLHFADARAEHDYEVDRYDTHRMLIGVLLADRKPPGGAMPASMQTFVDRAAALRVQADAKAGQGDHAAAVKLLEDATRELVRAIRAGGLYIPG